MASKIKNNSRPITAADIDIAVRMLKTHVDNPEIAPLILALETLRTKPLDDAYQSAVIDAFNKLTISQGAALTYAPYLNVFMSDDPFGDKPTDP